MAIASERGLLDTNVLVFAHDAQSPRYKAARALCNRGLAGELTLCLTPQVLMEFYAVVTNPARVTTPRTSEEALREVEALQTAFELLAPLPDLHDQVFRLVATSGVTGRHIFDLALAATMLGHDVHTIYTHDPRTFARVPGITVRQP